MSLWKYIVTDDDVRKDGWWSNHNVWLVERWLVVQSQCMHATIGNETLHIRYAFLPSKCGAGQECQEDN